MHGREEKAGWCALARDVSAHAAMLRQGHCMLEACSELLLRAAEVSFKTALQAGMPDEAGHMHALCQDVCINETAAFCCFSGAPAGAMLTSILL